MTLEEALEYAKVEHVRGIDENEEDNLCLINTETREIDVPENILLGVESDDKAKRIYFKCQRIVEDNLDLAQLSIRINWENANYDKGQYIVDDVFADENNIYFSWLLFRNVTKYKGEVKWIVCAVDSQDGIILKEWNTTLARADVLEGIEIENPIIDEDTEDVIEQLLGLMRDTSSSAVQAVKEAEKNALEQIANSTLPKLNDEGVLIFKAIT